MGRGGGDDGVGVGLGGEDSGEEGGGMERAGVEEIGGSTRLTIMRIDAKTGVKIETCGK
jgi:hypothetical protein